MDKLFYKLKSDEIISYVDMINKAF